MSYRPTICLDFDGVIHSYESGWKGAGVIPDPPVLGAIAFIEKMQAEGFTVAIHSSRSSSLRGRWAMKKWLEPHVIEHFGVDRVAADDCLVTLRWPWFKPASIVTIDDRAIAFDGTWPTAEAIRSFRPWNKRSVAL
jgi:hypothetical protein